MKFLAQISIVCIVCVFAAANTQAQLLEQQLLAESAVDLAKAAKSTGDARRGAIVFHQPQFACNKCHSVGDETSALGPNLSSGESKLNDEELVDSVLRPSKLIREKYRSVSVLTEDGTIFNGFVESKDKRRVIIRDASKFGKLTTIQHADVELVRPNKTSLMPAGQVNQLSGRQQFLDLIKYLMDVRDGGRTKAMELQPPPHLLVAPPIPEYEKSIDHAGLIRDLDTDSFSRGEAIYNRLCINCHGTKDQPGSLPNSLRFASGKFKNSAEPYGMYQTLTRGFGMMLPQTWMVPQQKYDVIHYIRQAYLKPHNRSQLFEITDDYLASLPKGESRGPAPVTVEPWVNMDYGPSMINTFEMGEDATNFAYKGIAVRLDSGPGGVSRGNAWTVFDHDTMRLSVAWTKPVERRSQPFIDWQGIHFNGRHNIHPRISGQVHQYNLNGPGWANPTTGSFEDPRLAGRDRRKYGPLPNEWAKLHGIFSHGPRTIIDYSIGQTRIQESHALLNGTEAGTEAAGPVFGRILNIGPRDREMTLQVASLPAEMSLRETDLGVMLQSSQARRTEEQSDFAFNGASVAQTKGDDFDLTTRDYTITARIKTRKDGTIFSKTEDGDKWVPNGKALFVRGGRLTFDIGWVGAVTSKRKIADGKWHDIAMTWKKGGRVDFYIDRQRRGGGELKPKQPVQGHVVRLGMAGKNFPSKTFFDGSMQDVRFYQRALSAKEIANLQSTDEENLIARWAMQGDSKIDLFDSNGDHDLTGQLGESEAGSAKIQSLAAGLSVPIENSEWRVMDGKRLCLTIPAGRESLRFVLWTRSSSEPTAVALSKVDVDDPTPNLRTLMDGGPMRWPEKLTTTVQRGNDDGPFAVDVLTAPLSNPWLARVRLTGLDFYDDGDRMAICCWDGDVWMVSGLSQLDASDSRPVQLTWQRIASGLFQPLGLKIVDGRIFVSCRDQIAILNDLNGDGETDHYECFNRDHQVTDHFHEFAMGLQTDDEGNFYYAKSARHAKTALVPHHGTLLRVSRDGSRTEILANGFRAANGVCLNPDGSFIVTDQEGHWNPKNRINWVKPGGFYGNMFGYHDVTDSSDDAMDQPLCWITNSFDRSPSELLWVNSDKWAPLQNRLLNLSYGYGKVYIVPHEEVDGQKQGGMCEFPIPQFPTGTMRGRFRKDDGQLYLCGMFAWGSNQKHEGGLYRLRYTGKPVHLPVEINATEQGVRLLFSGDVDEKAAVDITNYNVKVWSLKRTANYGSKHYDERNLDITSAKLGADQRTVMLTIPEIQTTWCMEIKYQLQSPLGTPIRGTIHNTIHRLGKP